ncbi:Heterokaryon incompatibility 6 OR allele protein [Rutstroemia sp. NJR-2017a BVV2]|nr:Heterokaryon incompatibility 6 OR allele protein [Rutstroemia sp. NJR-2017a BVV2]
MQRFEGLGLRSASGVNDDLVEYDALSYTWGTKENEKTIECNGIDFPITENLFNALLALRYPGNQDRYLWVDAICINQSDDDEKGHQVGNMLIIYQKACKVIAWLGIVSGETQKSIEIAITEAAVVAKMDISISAAKINDFWTTYAGLRSLYTRPWFRRIWVQQEVFGARRLILQIGTFSFEWFSLLHQPNFLAAGNPNLLAHIQFDSPYYRKSTFAVPEYFSKQIDAIEEVYQLRKQNLKSFKRFSAKAHTQPDFIEALLDTGLLDATDPKDYIYGVIGMTQFPTRKLFFEDWKVMRDSEIFIPIDYSIDYQSLLLAVTWAILMKGGLAILAKFKVFSSSDPEDEHESPSWIIDWRLAARLFTRRQVNPFPGRYIYIDFKPVQGEEWVFKLQNAWHNGKLVGPPPMIRHKLMPYPPSRAHEQFCKENNGLGTTSFTQLVLHGFIDTRFRISIEDNEVFFKELLVHPSELVGPTSNGFDRHGGPIEATEGCWRLDCDIESTDIVVCMLALRRIKHLYHHQSIDEPGSPEYQMDGLWLLRPVEPLEKNQYKLVAFLTWRGEKNPLYDLWSWNPTPESRNGAHRRLLVQSYIPQRTDYFPPTNLEPVYYAEHPGYTLPPDWQGIDNMEEVRTFTII